ncbi:MULTISPECIES: 50S ribosomal protein L29 [Nonlabens]|uniref:Large ribosomal subunit protein uL29 n=1 Tax=Nonlabens agnitus TaxID=870484 RepID=A0A2S9WQI5_9FLAO|nr:MULTISPECIES: 50S ribosomal protein L29 [Nonlabens]KQC32935.1 50S ribosomal protein L29 [Nonlabens sp. YIK11]PRP65735.1 50S ribosomal protein L29 [Nonlabens agnitus]
MKQSEVKGYSQEELKDRLAESQKSYADLKRTHIVSPLENPSQITKARKTIARLKTALNNS